MIENDHQGFVCSSDSNARRTVDTPNDTPNISEIKQKYEEDIRSLRAQCEKDKMNYLDGLKAFSERQEAIVKALNDNFNQQVATLNAEKNFYVNACVHLKGTLDNKDRLSHIEADLIKNGFESNISEGSPHPKNYFL